MVRTIDQEMTAIEKLVCYSQFPRGGAPPCLGEGEENAGKRQEQSGGGRREGKTRARALFVVSAGRNR